MDSLTLNQIKQISDEVRMQDITYSHLLHDLIDHVCCDVEYEMDNGSSFGDAYLLVKQKIGMNGLRKIQSDTLYVIDSKYRTMKNTMKTSGIAGTILLGFAALFKIMHWPGAGIMLTLGAFILAFIFLPTSLSVLYKESKNGKRMMLFISFFLASFFFIAGVLFKIQHWPGANYALCLSLLFAAIFLPQMLSIKLRELGKESKRRVYITGFIGSYLYLFGMLFKFEHWPFSGILYLLGAVLLFGISFPWYAWLSWKDEAHVNTTFLYLVPTIIWIMISTGLINLNISYNYQEGFALEFSRQQAINVYLSDKTEKQLATIKDSILLEQCKAIQTKSRTILNQIQQMKMNMLNYSIADFNTGKPAYLMREIDFNEHISNFAPQLLGTSAERNKLEAALMEYGNFITKQSSAYPAIGEASKKLLQVSTCLPDTSLDYALTVGSAMNQLTMLQNSILLTESELMSQLLKNEIANLNPVKK